MRGGLVLRERARSYRVTERSTTDWHARYAGNRLCRRRQAHAEIARLGQWDHKARAARVYAATQRHVSRVVPPPRFVMCRDIRGGRCAPEAIHKPVGMSGYTIDPIKYRYPIGFPSGDEKWPYRAFSR